MYPFGLESRSYLVHQYLEITLINAWHSIFSLLRIRRFLVENRYALKTYSSAQSQNFEIVVSFASSYKWSLRAHRCNKLETFVLDLLRPEEYTFFPRNLRHLCRKHKVSLASSTLFVTTALARSHYCSHVRFPIVS